MALGQPKSMWIGQPSRGLTGVSVVEVAGCWRGREDGSSAADRWEAEVEAGLGVGTGAGGGVAVITGEGGAAVAAAAMA